MPKTIGVLGGMGPESTAIFYRQIILECQKQYGAQYDEDYPEMLIYNLPIPDVVEGLKDQSKTLAMLVEGSRKLESIGVDFLVMPCGSAHYFYGDVKKQLSIPFLSIVKETAKKVKSRGHTKVGLLATKTTIDHGVYNAELNGQGIEVIAPREQDKLTEIILNILAGKKLGSDKQELLRIISTLKSNGAQAIILGCTDLPALLDDKDVDLELFDATKILAEATVKYAMA